MLPRKTELPTLVRSPLTFLFRYALPLVVLLIGGVADGVTTYQNTVAYGAGVEVHPVQQWLFEWLGPAIGVPVAKSIQVGFVLLVAAWWKPWCGWILALCGLLYVLAAMNNHFLWL